MTDITGPVGPQDRKMCEHEFRNGADLFKKALDHYNKSDNPYQKAEFKDVMDKAMDVMNQSAHDLMRKELEEQTQKISKDYETFQKYPGNPDTLAKLNSDLDQAKKSIKD